MSCSLFPPARIRFVAICALASGLVAGGLSYADQLDSAWQEQVNADGAAMRAQVRIEKLSDETQDMVVAYRQVLAETADIKRYNDQLAQQVDVQEQQIPETERQIEAIGSLQRGVLPLMDKMVETLDQFVQLDTPFLPEERAKRIADLKAMMPRPEVATSEKYRRILEAYSIELEYGRTFDTYNGRIGEGEDARVVDFIRVGRVTLMYQTPDGTETGYWDANAKDWMRDDSFERDVKNALKIAKKQGAPDLITVPVRAPVEVTR
jgi:hypothetical protein